MLHNSVEIRRTSIPVPRYWQRFFPSILTIYNQIGDTIQLTSESDKPFAYLGLVKYFNGIGIEQSRDYIQSYCHNYIDMVMIYHRWNKENPKIPYKPPSTISLESLKQLLSHSRPK